MDSFDRLIGLIEILGSALVAIFLLCLSAITLALTWVAIMAILN